MFTCLLVVCVGLAGDGWSYAKCESRPGISKAAARTDASSVPATFTGRSVAKFVEHTHAAPLPVTPAVQPKPAPALPVTVKADSLTPKCGRCGQCCECGDTCVCVNVTTAAPPEKRWYVTPLDPNVEGFGYVDANNVLIYDALRPRATVTIQPPTIYYPTYTQAPVGPVMMCLPGRKG